MNQQHPLVSIIIPNYNGARTLPLCLAAVAAQEYAPTEVIVVDDASTDDSVRVAETAGATVLRTPVNSGQAAARNAGAAHARGEILFFLDSDVALDPDAIGNAVAALRARPRHGAICGILHPESLLSTSLPAQYRGLQIFHWWMPTEGPTRELHAALLAIPAKVFAEIGPFNPALRDTEAADYRGRLVERYEVGITATVRGRHDHDPTVRMILRKVFRRALASALEWRRGELPGDSVSRALAGVLVVAAVLAAPLPLLAGPVTIPVAPLLVAGAIALDGATYRRVFARRGPLFGLYFVAMHLLVTFVATVAMGIGVLLRPVRRPAAGMSPPAPARQLR
jgi:hypothetical protein